MTKKSLGDCIPLEFDEMPSIEALGDSIERLRKDAIILAKVKSKKDTVKPENLEIVANFLESLSTRGNKRLKDS